MTAAVATTATSARMTVTMTRITVGARLRDDWARWWRPSSLGARGRRHWMRARAVWQGVGGVGGGARIAPVGTQRIPERLGDPVCDLRKIRESDADRRLNRSDAAGLVAIAQQSAFDSERAAGGRLGPWNRHRSLVLANGCRLVARRRSLRGLRRGHAGRRSSWSRWRCTCPCSRWRTSRGL